MAVTTIKVTTQTRDLLRDQAAALGLSLGDYVGSLARDHERATRWEQLRGALAAHPPSEEARAEDAAWDALAADGLEAEEW
ncbi:hypothetical protein [Nocardioides sp.]|uniref:hypothetical protein n=1 Tax=Nocardioides sp. TaxID=35761 RepID=UPI0026162EF5|nr:hypothetical protein [Nocardioides sp.]